MGRSKCVAYNFLPNDLSQGSAFFLMFWRDSSALQIFYSRTSDVWVILRVYYGLIPVSYLSYSSSP